MIGKEDKIKTGENMKKAKISTESRIQIEVNDNLFFLQKYFFFMLNYINNFKDTIKDSDLFGVLDKVMPVCDIERIINNCTNKKIRKEFKEKRSRRERVDFEDDSISEIIAALWNSKTTRLKLKKTLNNIVEQYINDINNVISKIPDYKNMYEERFKLLKENFQLSDNEITVLIMQIMIDENYLDSSDFQRHNKLGLIQRFSALVGCSVANMLQIVSPKGKLRRFGFIDENIDLTSGIQSFLNGMDDQPLSSKYYSQIEDKPLPWEYFSKTAETHGEIIKALIGSVGNGKRKGLNILLYGEPGTGKTSFATALAKECELTAYAVAQNKIEGKSDSSSDFRFAALHICDYQIDSKSSLVVIDEADEMLRGRASNPFDSMMQSVGDKGHLNTVLDKINSTCIWVANINKNELDASTARRFDYAVRFEPLTIKQRTEVWKNSIKKHNINILSDQVLQKIAEKYKLSAGGIDVVMNNLSTLISSSGFKKSKVEDTLEALIKPHCELLNIKTDDKKYSVAADYSPEGLNVNGDISPNKIVESVANFRKELKEAKENRVGGIDSPRMNILLYGPPGTGKTEFVKYLAAEMKCDIHVKMGSDILSKYVGESEEKIKYAFREAEESGSILFIDEIDGLLRSRGMAKNSWEVTQVNELLYQMENFKGVLVCATNFKKNLDPATIRRFLLKVKFDYLDEDGKVIFYKKMLAKLANGKLTRSEIAQLKSIKDLTPGDFRNIRQASYYLNREDLTHKDLLGRLQDEVAEKTGAARHKIGFAMSA